MSREPGFYWIRNGKDWEIAEWSICWERIGDEIVREDSYFDEIDERRIERSDKDVIDFIKANYPKEDLPKIIVTNPYLCKPDES